MASSQLPCLSERFWKVKEGDTFYLIASFVGTTVEELKNLNPNIDPNNLQIGQEICLPPERPCPSGIFWEVAAGDTLDSIARANDTTVDKLLELNPNINPQNLQIGQAICLP